MGECTGPWLRLLPRLLLLDLGGVWAIWSPYLPSTGNKAIDPKALAPNKTAPAPMMPKLLTKTIMISSPRSTQCVSQSTSWTVILAGREEWSPEERKALGVCIQHSVDDTEAGGERCLWVGVDAVYLGLDWSHRTSEHRVDKTGLVKQDTLVI